MVISISYLEKDVEDLLHEDSQHYLGLRFVGRQIKTPVGVLDVIARAPTEIDEFLYYVIEIKRDTIDASAYVQALRYSKWLNSEYSRRGRRLFVPLLIGGALSNDLNTVCEKFYTAQAGGLNHFGKVYYTLFSFSARNGVSFEFHSAAQRTHAQSLRKRYCHATELWWQLDELKSENAGLKQDTEALEGRIERNQETLLQLVKPAAGTAV